MQATTIKDGSQTVSLDSRAHCFRRLHTWMASRNIQPSWFFDKSSLYWAFSTNDPIFCTLSQQWYLHSVTIHYQYIIISTYLTLLFYNGGCVDHSTPSVSVPAESCSYFSCYTGVTTLPALLFTYSGTALTTTQLFSHCSHNHSTTQRIPASVEPIIPVIHSISH